MYRKLILIILGTSLVAGATALASGRCDRPMRDWRPREAAAAKAQELGIEVSRIRTDDGCYKIHGRIADGRSIEIKMDPVTLEVLKTKYRDQAHREDHHEHHEDDRGVSTPPSTQQVPANPLIGPATGTTK
ncbi:MAG: PepSY domain-containing protein [Azoarcus sp.]|jgi:hypothetical protein|nr:PepSY domain-containing protein [Azoarcus sp.]